jgi:hypothetical protein
VALAAGVSAGIEVCVAVLAAVGVSAGVGVPTGVSTALYTTAVDVAVDVSVATVTGVLVGVAVGVAVSAAGVPITTKGAEVARRPKVSLAKRRASYVPGVRGATKTQSPLGRGATALRVQETYCQAT